MCQLDPKVSHDCSLILEAVRRLDEGTGDLTGEDAEQARHLLPVVHDALEDHILLEEGVLLPFLPSDQCENHRREHQALQALLWSLELALSRMKSDCFHALLKMLNEQLISHHKFCLGEKIESAATQFLENKPRALLNTKILSAEKNLDRRYQQNTLEIS